MSLNRPHGKMTFYGIEIPSDVLYRVNKIYQDRCGHPHILNSKKAKYDFCEKCGAIRCFIENKLTEIGERLNDRLVYVELEDAKGEIIKKHYAVMEYYEGFVKLDFAATQSNPDKKNQFKALIKDLHLWRSSHYGLYCFDNVTPTTAFYKNSSLRNLKYATSPLAITDVGNARTKDSPADP